MSIARKYDNTLRKKYSLRAIWFPGTKLVIGDIMMLKDGAFVQYGKLRDFNITFDKPKELLDIASISIRSTGVSQSIIQAGAKLSLDKLDMALDAELKIAFNADNSYLLKTPKLTGVGMDSAIKVAKKISDIPTWDYRKYYVVKEVYHAKDFVFLASEEKGHDIVIKGKGKAISNIIENGISANLALSGDKEDVLSLTGEAGPVVMRLFRLKRNGDIY
jgi:hypothetical protein